MKYFFKYLTRNMIYDLKKVREKELSQGPANICSFYNFHGTLSSLHKKRFVEGKTVNSDDKEKLSIYVTQAGINFLKRYENNKKHIRIAREWDITWT